MSNDDSILDTSKIQTSVLRILWTHDLDNVIELFVTKYVSEDWNCVVKNCKLAVQQRGPTCEQLTGVPQQLRYVPA